MLTSQKVIDAINEQIGYEFSAELQYYAIAAHFAAEALPQLSQHFFQQAEEEKGHALRFIKYVVDAGGRVVIPAIDAPKSKFKTARDAVKLSLDQEIHVTQQINGLVGLARKQNDYITINFLQWFLTEQLEEVSSMDNLLKIIERAGTDLLQRALAAFRSEPLYGEEDMRELWYACGIARSLWDDENWGLLSGRLVRLATPRHSIERIWIITQTPSRISIISSCLIPGWSELTPPLPPLWS